MGFLAALTSPCMQVWPSPDTGSPGLKCFFLQRQHKARLAGNKRVATHCLTSLEGVWGRGREGVKGM